MELYPHSNVDRLKTGAHRKMLFVYFAKYNYLDFYFTEYPPSTNKLIPVTHFEAFDRR